MTGTLPIEKEMIPVPDDESDYNKRPFILGLNCSQYKDGDSAKSLQILLDWIEKCGGRAEMVHLRDFDIRPRLLNPRKREYPSLLRLLWIALKTSILYVIRREDIGQGRSGINHPFALNPDTKFLYDLLVKSDGIIVAPPVHWREPASPTIEFFERLDLLEEKDLLSGKVAAVIENYGLEEGGVADRLRGILNDMGFAIVPQGKVACSAVSNYIRRKPLFEAVGTAVIEEAFRGELDGTTGDLRGLAERVFLMARVFMEAGVNKPDAWS